jgi:(2Fe-2S) ferredoxin
MTATVLVGMSVADVDRRDDLLATARDAGASVAFLQMGDPSLSAELTRLADLGHDTITLIGVSLGPLAPGQSWLSRIAAHWWRERAGHRPEVRVAKRLATDLADLPDETRPITSYEPGLTSEAWEQVSGHRHQVNVCRGPRCTAKGAVDSLRAIILAMVEHELGDDDVLLVHTGCQFPCNQAPVLSVQPDDVWYGPVDPETARAIVAEHLVGGQPLASNRLNR